MANQATGAIAMNTWAEEPFAEQEGAPKLSRAHGSDLYHGELEGEAFFEYLMFYAEDGVTTYVGLIRFVGKLGDRAGSFVMQIRGTHQEGLVKAALTIEPDSGTGDLREIRGMGELRWEGSEGSVTLDYDLE